MPIFTVPAIAGRAAVGAQPINFQNNFTKLAIVGLPANNFSHFTPSFLAGKPFTKKKAFGFLLLFALPKKIGIKNIQSFWLFTHTYKFDRFIYN